MDILPESVIIMGNVLYYSVSAEKILTKFSMKLNIIQLLRNRGINYDEDMRNEHLFLIIELHRPREEHYKSDQFLQARVTLLFSCSASSLYVLPQSY